MKAKANINGPRHIAVIDIGKTNVKLALVNRPAMAELAVLTQPNRVLPGPPYPHFDTEGHWAFLLAGLAQFQASYGVDAISITTHGACVALLAADGSLATPVLDYEHSGPAETAAAYNTLRPDFAITGSPRLGNGLNLGAQLHWLLGRDPGLLNRVQSVVTWPQYWGYRLTGALACDVSSLGCHTDLWEPASARFSGLVDQLGLGGKMAQARRPDAVLGALLADIADMTGLARGTPVVCGIHDSNASLLPHLLTQTGPFAVVSTGTWVVCMAVGGAAHMLDAARDVLVNVAADGRAVPSARFMGGREYEILRAGRAAVTAPADERTALTAGLMLRPSSLVEGGPFPGCKMGWNLAPDNFSDEVREAALAFYQALMTAECLKLTGAAGPVIVEGPFAGNDAYCRMLAAACGRQVLRAESQTGTSIGAALLFGAPDRAPPLVATTQTASIADYHTYAQNWRAGIAT
jgi:sugar (pentulose or hexulose) kinase